MDKKNKMKSYTKKGTMAPILIRTISLLLILGSSIGILLYAYIFIFNLEILSEKISIIKNPFVSPLIYILLESVVFTSIIIGALFLLYLKRTGIFIIIVGLILLMTLNYAYFVNIDWLYIVLSSIIMLIFWGYRKKFT